LIQFGAGDLLREELKKDSERANTIKKIMQDGKIVPSEITTGLLLDKMSTYSKDKIILIDGFPRNTPNIDSWEKLSTNAKVICIINLECSKDICTERILKRAEVSLNKRIDDDKEIIEKRFNSHFKDFSDMSDHLKNNYKMIDVNAEKDVNDVFEDLVSKLKDVL